MRGNLSLPRRCPLTMASMMAGWSDPKLTKTWLTPACQMASKKASDAVYPMLGKRFRALWGRKYGECHSVTVSSVFSQKWKLTTPAVLTRTGSKKRIQTRSADTELRPVASGVGLLRCTLHA